MALEPVTSEKLKAIRDEAGFDEETIRRNAKEIQQWLSLQPHLPNCHDLHRLELLFLHCKGEHKKMKESLDVYYTMKNKVKEILLDRDPDSQWFRETKEAFFYIPLPKVTDDHCRVTLGGLLNPEVHHEANNVIKIAHMIQDIRYLSEYCPNDVYVTDMKDVSLGTILKYPLHLLTKIRDFGLVAYRVQFKSGHFINAPIYLDILMALIKLVLKPKLFQRLHVHRNGVGNLYDFIPQSVMPNEYGGTAGPVRELWDTWIKTVESHRAWYLEQDNYRADESKRPKKKKK